jgi:tetratricopeptide (TPR) repeat protein
MPMQVEIPTTLASLLQAIDSIQTPPDINVVIEQAREAIAAYDQLTPEQRAAYTHAIRTDIQSLKDHFSGALTQALHAYPGNTSPQKSVELAQLAVQAGQPELAHRFLSDAQQLGADEGLQAQIQAQVAAVPATLAPLSASLTASDTPPTASDMNLIGLERLANEDAEGAKQAFESAVDLDPTNPEHLNNLALTQLQQGLLRQAAEGSIQALEQRPTLSPANLAVATTALQHAVAWARDNPGGAAVAPPPSPTPSAGPL